MYRGLKGYLLLLVFETISATGSTLTTFVLSVWAWEKYGSPRVLAEVLAAFYLPKILLTPIAGVYVDRWPRKSILVVGNLLSAATVGALALQLATDSLSFVHIGIVGFVQAALAGFRQPTLDASIGPMVPKDRLTRINALAQSLQHLPEIIGPLGGALILGFAPRVVLVEIDAFTFLAAALGTLLVDVPRPRPDGEAKVEPFWVDVQLGSRFILKNRPLLMCALALALFNVFGGAFLETLILPMASISWQHQPAAQWLGAFMVRIGSQEGALSAQLAACVTTVLFLGIVIGGAVAAARGLPFKSRVNSIAIGIGVAGVCQACLGSSSLAVPLVASLVLGLTGVWRHAPLQAIWISKTPPAIQGRVFSSLGLISQLTYPVGLLIVSLCSQVFRPSMLFIMSGIALGMSALVWLLVPSLHNIDVLVPDLDYSVDVEPS